MLKFLAILTFAVIVSGQTWVSDANLKGGTAYWINVVQEMMYEVERRGWWNMKLNDITQIVDDSYMNMRVNGTVRYTRGFVVSIQKIDLTEVSTNVVSRTVDEQAVPFGTAAVRVNFRNMKIGHDVHADLVIPEGHYRGTGTFLHTTVQIQLNLNRNLMTNETTVSGSVMSVNPALVTGAGPRMIYMPANNITEAVGRTFASSTSNSARIWISDIFDPIIVDLVNNKLGFPGVCFVNC